MTVSQALIFHFKCYCILPFAVCQLLRWAFLLCFFSLTFQDQMKIKIYYKIVKCSANKAFWQHSLRQIFHLIIGYENLLLLYYCYLASNGVIAKIALRDCNLLFGGQTFNIFISLKRLGSRKKCAADICRL